MLKIFNLLQYLLVRKQLFKGNTVPYVSALYNFFDFEERESKLSTKHNHLNALAHFITIQALATLATWTDQPFILVVT